MLVRYCNGTSRQCQSKDSLNLTLEVVDIAPKVFIIRNFLSGFEADAIVQHAMPLLSASLVGNAKVVGPSSSNTRTSKHAWIKRETSPITESLFLRAADLLKVDESMLYVSEQSEPMQVVHYEPGQRYENHHDWCV